MLPANILAPGNSEIGIKLNRIYQKLIFKAKSKPVNLKIHIKIKLNNNPKNTIKATLK